MFSLKRPTCAVEEDEQDLFFEHIRGIVQDENKAIVNAMEKRMSAIETRQEQL